MNTGPNTGKNRKKVLIVGRMPQAGLDVLKKLRSRGSGWRA